MSEPITDEELAAIEALVKAATPGPWFFAYNKVWSEPRVREYDRLIDAIPDDTPEDDPRWATIREPTIARVDTIAGDTASKQGQGDGEFIAALWPERALALVAMARESSANRAYAVEADMRIAALEGERDHYRQALAMSQERARLLREAFALLIEGMRCECEGNRRGCGACVMLKKARTALAETEAT